MFDRFAVNGMNAQAAIDKIEETMSRAVQASGCKNRAEFGKLPREEQNAFVAQANGSQRPEAIAAEERDQEFPCAQIIRSPWNREHSVETDLEELTESVRKHGVLQAGIGRPYKDSELHTPADRARAAKMIAQGLEVIELIAGERRWKAAARAGRKMKLTIKRNCTDEEAIELQAIENLQRVDPNALETAEKFQQLMTVYGARGLAKEEAIEEIRARVSNGGDKISRSSIYDALRLLKLPQVAKKAIGDGVLPASQALEIAKLEHDRKMQLEVTELVLAKPKGRAGENEREELRNDKGLMSHRATKELVKAKLAFMEERAKYNKLREEMAAQIGRILSAEENAKYLESYGTTWGFHYHSGASDLFVKGNNSCYSDCNGRAYEKLWKKAPPAILGQLDSGAPVIFYDRKEADEAAKAGGKCKVSSGRSSGGGGGGQKKSAADLKKEADERKRKLVFQMTLEQISLAEGRKEQESDEFWRMVAPALMPGCLSQDWRKMICRMHGWKEEGFNTTQLTACIQNMSAPQIRALVLQNAIFQEARYSFKGPLLDAAAKLHQVSPAELGRALEQAADQDEDLPSQIVKAFQARPGESLNGADIASDLKVDKRAVYIALATKLSRDKRLVKVSPGFYTAAGGEAAPVKLSLADHIVAFLEEHGESYSKDIAAGVEKKIKTSKAQVMVCISLLLHRKRVKQAAGGKVAAVEMQASGRKGVK